MQERDVSESYNGVYITLDELLRCRSLAKDLKLSKQRKILSHQAGLHGSKFRGRGIDFAEVRAYQAGDDIRSIDWRVTARTGKPHTKLYTEERERPALVIVDQSQSMFFGSQVAFKSVLAARAGALLAWAALARGDRIGAIVFSDEHQKDIRPRRSHHSVLTLTETLVQFNHALGTQYQPERNFSLCDALEQARRTLKPGSELFVVSDFQHFDEACQRHLFQMSRHNDIVCICIYDQLEMELPPPGYYSISDGRDRAKVDLYDSTLRTRYQAAFTRRMERLQTKLDQLKVPLVTLRTDDDLLTTLSTGLGIRKR